MNRGKKALNNSPNDNNDLRKTKENVTSAKEMIIINPFMALQVEEGEIPVEDSTLEGEEPKERGYPDPSALPNAGEDGTEKTIAGSSYAGGSWVAMVKKSRPNSRVESPGNSSSQGSQEILDQAPPPSIRGRKMHRHHREQEAERELKLGR